MCPPSAKALKNGLTARTLLVNLLTHTHMLSQTLTYKPIFCFFCLLSRSGQGHVKVTDNYAQHANVTFPSGFESCNSF